MCSIPSKSDVLCDNDSGGPLICDGLLYGIASHRLNFMDDQNITCDSPNVQTRYLYINKYTDWIKNITNINSIGNILILHEELYTSLVFFNIVHYFVVKIHTLNV